MIPVGAMDRCIVLQSVAETRGTDGSYGKTWTDAHSVKAAYNYRSGGEAFEGDQETAYRMVTFTTRYLDSVDETWRVKHGTDLYDIVNVQLDGRRKYMILHCVKKTVYQEK